MRFNWGRFLLTLVSAASQEVAVAAKSSKTRQTADIVGGVAALTKLTLESRKAEEKLSPFEDPRKAGVGG